MSETLSLLLPPRSVHFIYKDQTVLSYLNHRLFFYHINTERKSANFSNSTATFCEEVKSNSQIYIYIYSLSNIPLKITFKHLR